MALTGTRKAAMLLMGLDPPTAAELLKAAELTTITKIAAELASLDTAGHEGLAGDEPVREFHGLLTAGAGGKSATAFMRRMLTSAVSRQDVDRVLGDVEHMMQLRDPFRTIRESSTAMLAAALRGESAQVAAMVLGSLSPKQSAELLPMLDEGIRVETVRGMASNDAVAPEAKLRVAAAVESRLRAPVDAGAAPVPDEEPETSDDRFRRAALLVRGLKAEFREGLMAEIMSADEETGKHVQRMMVVWEDVAAVSDRSLQESLRSVDSRRLALSLVNADPATAERIRSNISERASSMLDEETSLLTSPKDDDIIAAREAILDSLRDLNSEGELHFEDE